MTIDSPVSFWISVLQSGVIYDLELLDSNTFFSGSENEIAKWNLNSETSIDSISTIDNVFCLKILYINNIKRLAACVGSEVFIYDITTNLNLLNILYSHGDKVVKIDLLSQDILVSVSHDNTAIIFDINSNAIRQRLSLHNGQQLKTVLSIQNGIFATSGLDR